MNRDASVSQELRRTAQSIAAAVLIGSSFVAFAQPKLEIAKQVPIVVGNVAVPRSIVRGTDGTVIFVGEQAGKSETGGGIWVAKLSFDLQPIWQITIPVGALPPSAYSVSTAIAGPEGSVHVFTRRSAYQKDAQAIVISGAGKILNARPLKCDLGIDCPVNVQAAIGQSDGIVSIRNAVISPTQGQSRGQVVRLIHKMAWEGETVWQRTDPLSSALVLRIVPNSAGGFTFAENLGFGAVAIGSFDALGMPGPRFPLNGKWSEARLFGVNGIFVFLAMTDMHPESAGARLGGQLVELDQNSRELGKTQVADLSYASSIFGANSSLVLFGSGRNEIGERTHAKALLLDPARKSISSLLFSQFGHSSRIVAAVQGRNDLEFVVTYDAWQYQGQSSTSSAIASIVVVRP